MKIDTNQVLFVSIDHCVISLWTRKGPVAMSIGVSTEARKRRTPLSQIDFQTEKLDQLNGKQKLKQYIFQIRED